ncbi:MULTISPECIES: GGDEF domain-containing protein [Marinobacter]|jgi:diguanylate cyclase (GGDEF)-like protein|uniref:diguanylate cyclase n=2 Tax=Marinobacter salarius TaxID=1420917 RepID=W5YTC4_9GAMM|nr:MULTISPECIES: GGDEF domain-containing protein [Marinobacter]AHI32305.1 diguanylate cyclase [Marinobacter salarius]KXJ45404.1 MAG: diguanylate cyclase [Marinobacter sp. Hex_13]|tara:strand:- start:2549 stop:3610 length:1062 start_codon:yes stop_codon:yes gene_type:complete
MNQARSMSARESIRERRPQFWQVAKRCCQIAATVDVAFFFLFHMLGSPILAWVNVVSVTMYVVAYRALGRKQNGLAIGLIWAEVIIHAGLGIVLIGWDSGFHYYLLMFIPALFVSMALRSAVICLVALWSYYIALYLMMWFIEPLQPVAPGALLAVYLFNLSVVFAMFSYLSFFYLTMVTTANRKLRRMATTDSLTGLFNRRHMTYLAEKELARFRRTGRPVAFLVLDIDHFKAINDRHGHEIGDRVLIEVANIIEAQLRIQDLISRWGGEEFLAVLPDTSLNSAQASAERVRKALLAHDWLATTDEPIDLSISAGVSEFRRGDNLNSAISRADRALYRSKEGGRNRVELEAG